MSVLFGRQWEASNGEIGGDVFKVWADALANFSTDQIKQGLEYMTAEGSEFPPNLIKFRRLCLSNSNASFQDAPKALPRPQPHYSVMRIEMAKQKALTGEAFEPVKLNDRMITNWTGDDEAALFDLINQWDESTGHEGLNRLIDGYKFSDGAHHNIAGLSELIASDESQLGTGTIRYRYFEPAKYYPLDFVPFENP